MSQWSHSHVCSLLTLILLLKGHFHRVVTIPSIGHAFTVPYPKCRHISRYYHLGRFFNRDAAVSKDYNHNDGERTFLLPPKPHREENRSVSFGRNSPVLTLSDPPSLENEEWLDPPVSVPDPYGWMRWRDDATMQEKQQILDHIREESDYVTTYFGSDGGHRKSLQQELIQEYESFLEAPAGRSSKKYLGEISQLYQRDGYFHYIRRPTHQPYPLHCRMKADQFQHFYSALEGDDDDETEEEEGQEANGEEVLLDENVIAEHFLRDSMGTFFSIHSVVPILLPYQESLRNTTLFGLAFSLDLVGDECHSIYFLRFPMAPDFSDNMPLLVANTTSGSIEYEITRKTVDEYSFSLHYIAIDKTLCRPYQWVEWHFRNRTNTILYTELDPRFWGDLSKTSDGQYLLWKSKTSSGSVGSILSLNLEDSHDRLPISLQLEISSNIVLDHRNNQWWILDLSITYNTSCPEGGSGLNYDISKTELFTSSEPDASNLTPIFWSSTIQPTAAIFLESLVTFSDYIVLLGRQDGLRRLWILNVNEQDAVMNVHQLLTSNQEDAYYMDMAPKQDYESQHCVIWYESMVTPPQLWSVCLMDGKCRVLYAKNFAGYAKSDYCCQRLYVPSRDCIASIPVSLVHHKSVQFPCPIHLLGYGAYGHSLEPSFSTLRLPMLNRGIACAVAHVRGGGEMGRPWHDSGRCSFKRNSINDFVDVAAWFIDHNFTRSHLLVAEGRSAGGLLVAAAMNQKPNLFHSVVLGVPFLDILCTMADSTIPLTTTEWDEWGNPHTRQGFESIREYAPMHNIVANTPYPSCLMVGGRQDPRVPYWEPLKFAASLRHIAQTRRPILVKIDASAGHSFGNNRAKYFEEMAFIYAFVIDEICTNSTEQH